MSLPSPIRVSIVEDDDCTRDNLVALLTRQTRFQYVASYANAEEALADLPNRSPDVVLVDINLPGMNGIECVSQLKLKLPELHFVMLTTYPDTELIFNALRAGATGYLLKNSPFSELVQAIEQVQLGGAPMSIQIARKVVDHFYQIEKPASDLETLSSREKEILALLAKGYLYKQIGDQLGITYDTVRAHIRHIYEKLHVQSRTEATLKYLGKA